MRASFEVGRGNAREKPVNIRPVAPQDRDQWLEMRSAFWPDGAEEHAEEIDLFLAGGASEPRAVIVADAGERLLGFVELSIRPFAEGCLTNRVGYLEGWYVGEERRGEGIGRGLLEAAEEWAARRGCREFASDTRIDNEPGVRAHLACGFEDAGTVRCFRKLLRGRPASTTSP